MATSSDWVGQRPFVKASDILQQALDRLGPNGEHWAQGGGVYKTGMSCVMMAVHRGEGFYSVLARQFLFIAMGIDVETGDGVDWNDQPTTTWPMVKEALIKARDHALMVGA